MNCAYDGACQGKVRPLWIRSVGIPLCERHVSTIQLARTFDEQDPDPRALELLAALAVAVLLSELTGRGCTLVA